MATNLHGRVNDRKKRRMPCKLTVDQRQHNGLLLDLSRSGLFVQTTAKARTGQQFPLVMADASGAEMQLTVEVVRRKAVPPRLLSVAQGGLGVRIVDAPDAYRAFLREIGIPDDAPCASQSGRLFALLMRQPGSSRSRRVEIEAADADEAAAEAVAQLGDEWKVQSIDELD